MKRPSSPPPKRPNLRGKEIVHIGLVDPQRHISDDNLMLERVQDIFANPELKTHGDILLKQRSNLQSRSLPIIEELEDGHMEPNVLPKLVNDMNSNKIKISKSKSI